MLQRPSFVPHVADLDLVGTEHRIVASVVGEHWDLVKTAAGYDPETAEATLRRLRHSEGRANDLGALLLHYVLSRRAAGLPVHRPAPI